MKVCDVVLNSIWFDPRVRKQLMEYKTRGIEISAVGLRCSRYEQDKMESIPCAVSLVKTDPRYEGKQRTTYKKIKRAYLQNIAIRDAIAAEKPDIIHANDLSALIPSYLAARKLGCKLVYDSHEINVENFYAKKQPLYAFVLKCIERYLVRRVDLMVCVSHAAAEYFAQIYRIPKPMVVTNCSLQKEAVFGQFQKHEGFEILNHGQFYEGRGYDIMAQANALLRDYPEIHPAVRGFGRMEQQLHEMVDTLENRDQFRFYPPVTVQELIPMAARSHVGVAITEPICLNFKLSVSNKLFEYAAAGLPVIMSDIPEHRYLNEKYNFGLILPENTPQAFADAAIWLYQDRQLYEKLAENAGKLSMEVNWENEFGKLIEAEKQLLK